MSWFKVNKKLVGLSPVFLPNQKSRKAISGKKSKNI